MDKVRAISLVKPAPRLVPELAPVRPKERVDELLSGYGAEDELIARELSAPVPTDGDVAVFTVSRVELEGRDGEAVSVTVTVTVTTTAPAEPVVVLMVAAPVGVLPIPAMSEICEDSRRMSEDNAPEASTVRISIVSSRQVSDIPSISL